MPRTFSKNTPNYGQWGTNLIGPRINSAGVVVAGIRYRPVTIPTNAMGDNGLILILHGDNSGVGLSLGDGVGNRLLAYGRARDVDPQITQSSGTVVTTGVYHTSFVVMDFAGGRLKIHHDGVMVYDQPQTWGATAYLHTANTISDQIGLAWGAALPPTTTNQQLDGDVDWAAIWNADLTSAEMTAIHNGAWPGSVKTANCRELNPMTALRSPETSMVSGGTSFSIFGSLPSASGASYWAPWRGPQNLLLGGI